MPLIPWLPSLLYPLLTHPAVTSTIVGIKKLEHISTIVPATEVRLEQPDWHRMVRAMEKAKIAV